MSLACCHSLRNAHCLFLVDVPQNFKVEDDGSLDAPYSLAPFAGIQGGDLKHLLDRLDLKEAFHKRDTLTNAACVRTVPPCGGVDRMAL